MPPTNREHPFRVTDRGVDIGHSIERKSMGIAREVQALLPGLVAQVRKTEAKAKRPKPKRTRRQPEPWEFEDRVDN